MWFDQCRISLIHCDTLWSFLHDLDYLLLSEATTYRQQYQNHLFRKLSIISYLLLQMKVWQILLLTCIVGLIWASTSILKVPVWKTLPNPFAWIIWSRYLGKGFQDSTNHRGSEETKEASYRYIFWWIIKKRGCHVIASTDAHPNLYVTTDA